MLQMFDQRSVERIGNAVRIIEQMPQSRRTRRPGRHVGSAATVLQKPFDLIIIDNETIQILGFDLKGDATNKLIGLAGIWEDVTPGAGGVDLDTNIVIITDTFIFLKISTTDSGDVVTIETGAAILDSSDSAGGSLLFIPLYFIKFDGTNIALNESFNLRGLPRVDRMGN